MFCPDCARFYLKAKVCPHCGVKLLRATGKPENKQVSQRRSNNKVATQSGCPECGSMNYRVYRTINHRNRIRNSSLLVYVLLAVAHLFFLFRGWHKTCCCRECGHEWILKEAKE